MLTMNIPNMVNILDINKPRDKPIPPFKIVHEKFQLKDENSDKLHVLKKSNV